VQQLHDIRQHAIACLGRSVPWLIAGGFALAAAVGAEAQTARPVEHFNYVLGTQTFGPSYHFTAAPSVVETAGAIAALGSNTIKFQLKPTADGEQTLAEIARSDPVIKTVIDMPFANLLMWVYPPATRARLFDSATLGTEYSELYDLTRYLRQTYSGTGKVFFLGNWEMDNHLTTSRKKEPSPELLRDVTAWVATRQRAVDDAKRDTPGADVGVYYYLEVNLVGMRSRVGRALPTPSFRRPASIMFPTRRMIRCSPIPSKSSREPLIICSRNCSRKTDFPESGCSLANTVSPPTVIRRRTRTPYPAG
jgi:hypothetical protein